jgi:galactokinase
LLDLALDDVELAKVGQSVETDFVGAPVGIMDQMASSLAAVGEALFLDTRSLAFERIPLPPALGLVVIDSGVAHQHAGGDYVTRRRESEEAAQALGVTRLRDVSEDALPQINQLPPLLARRARHIVTENARVLAAREALRAGDLPRLGELFNASHRSMRDDYEVSIPVIDQLVAIATAQRGVFGARLTGGGFGGAIVIAAAAADASRVARDTAAEYERQTGTAAVILIPPRDTH